MKNGKVSTAVLQELANRWDQDAVQREDQAEGEDPAIERANILNRGVREGKRECADGLRTLISMLETEG